MHSVHGVCVCSCKTDNIICIAHAFDIVKDIYIFVGNRIVTGLRYLGRRRDAFHFLTVGKDQMAFDLRIDLHLPYKVYSLPRCHRSALFRRSIDIVCPYVTKMLFILKVISDDLTGSHSHLFKSSDLILITLDCLDIRISDDQEQYEPHYQKICNYDKSSMHCLPSGFR